MSKITLSESLTPHQDRQDSEKITHIKTDNDENDNDFKRLTLYTNHPVTDEETYWEFDKQSSNTLITKESDGSYSLETEELDYVKELWEVSEWKNSLFRTWKIAEENVDISSEWIDEVNIIPINGAMWDEIYVNKICAKKDYTMGCVGEEEEEINALIAKINEKFSNQPNFKSSPYNILGTYRDNHTLRPPYTTYNTVTFYEMYYKKADFNQLLTTFKVPDHSYSYRFWYGLKYDLDNSKRFLKIVIKDTKETSNYQECPNSFIPRPSLPPAEDVYFAKMYTEEGVEADEYDVFFTTTPTIMKKHCEKHSLDFPLPDNKINDYVWCFGIVYDKNTLAVKQVKGYVKIPQNAENWINWGS